VNVWGIERMKMEIYTPSVFWSFFNEKLIEPFKPRPEGRVTSKA
jgi:hypothetical protein